MQRSLLDVLHDGEIAEIRRSGAHTTRLQVVIAYLCGYLPTQADYLVVELDHCTQLSYQPFVGDRIVDPAAIAALRLTMLSTAGEPPDWRIEVADGSYGGGLELTFSAVRILTAEGAELTPETLTVAANQYWDDWAKRHDLPPSP